MILTAYFDDSGTHPESKAVVVAGYVATPEAWQAFEADWRRALDDYGLPFFHMVDFSNRAKAYAHWQEAQRRIRFGRLAEIIKDHVLGSFGTIIPTEPFNRLFSPKAKAHCGGAYGLAASVLFLQVAEIVRAVNEEINADAWIAYVLESGTNGHGQISKVFQYNEQNPDEKERLRLLSLRFENKRQFVALQAADILAYELYRLLPSQLGIDPRPARRAILSQLAGPTNHWSRLDEEEITKWSSIIETSADLAVLLGWPRKRGSESDPGVMRQTALNRAARRPRRRSIGDR